MDDNDKNVKENNEITTVEIIKDLAEGFMGLFVVLAFFLFYLCAIVLFVYIATFILGIFSQDNDFEALYATLKYIEPFAPTISDNLFKTAKLTLRITLIIIIVAGQIIKHLIRKNEKVQSKEKVYIVLPSIILSTIISIASSAFLYYKFGKPEYTNYWLLGASTLLINILIAKYLCVGEIFALNKLAAILLATITTYMLTLHIYLFSPASIVLTIVIILALCGDSSYLRNSDSGYQGRDHFLEGFIIGHYLK